ncbi:hypothetical protein CLD20_00865 [Afifella sp. IM 167]|nr:hypothetical protein [Afifella sp. IM 167]
MRANTNRTPAIAATIFFARMPGRASLAAPNAARAHHARRALPAWAFWSACSDQVHHEIERNQAA